MRAIVVEQRIVVAVHEERALAAADHRRGSVAFRQRVAAWQANAERLPLRERKRNGHVARRLTRTVAPRDVVCHLPCNLARHLYLSTPGFVRRPAVARQVVRDRREDVGGRRPDVAPAVAVVILRVLQVTRRHELHLSHRAGPRSAKVREIDVAAVDDLERVEQLAPEERRPPRIPRERRQRHNRRPDAAEAAEVGLQPPDGDDDAWRDAVGLADLGQQGAMLLESLTRSPDEFREARSEEHTSELQSLTNLVCRLLLEKKKN